MAWWKDMVNGWREESVSALGKLLCRGLVVGSTVAFQLLPIWSRVYRYRTTVGTVCPGYTVIAQS